MSIAVVLNSSTATQAAACLIRIEGVNHSQFIFDTADLSTVRGGGLLMLNAIEEATNVLKVGPTASGCEVISSGASSGLFRVFGAAPATAAQAVRDALNQGAYAHASFVVAAIPDTGNFSLDNETLITLNRHEQMTQPALQVPKAEEKQGLGVCAIDRIRPAVIRTKIKGKEGVTLSASVAARREHGVKQKQHFYTDTLKKSFDPQKASPHGTLAQRIEQAGLRFADDFSDIADDKAQEGLSGKLAVFYADGNSFGRHQRGATTAEALSGWDQHIKTLRRDLLAQLIEPYFDEAEKKNEKIRFETLLWGGDELLFVVPAWKGLVLVQAFLKATQSWEYPAGSGQRLTHAMGLVFCHSNTPIARIQQLARTLGDQAKIDAGRETDSLHMVVLESFDHVGASWTDYLQRTYRGQLKSADRFIKGDGFNRRLEEWTHLKRAHPKGRLHDFLQALLKPEGASDQDRDRLTHDLQGDLKTLLDKQAATPAWFFLAAELWDYLPNDPDPVLAAATDTEGARA